MDSIQQYQSSLRELFGTDHPVVWVTGSAAPRVGREIAWRFARHGYRIVLHGQRAVQEGEQLIHHWNSLGHEAMLITGPIDRDECVDRWIDQIQQRFGRLDVFVNSAAIWEPKALEETTVQDLERHWRSNTLGTFLCAQKAGLWMANQPSGGAIVLVSDWAVERPYADFAAYFASKGSIATIMRALAVELALRNPRIRVNGVLPGPVLLSPEISEELADKIRQQSLLKRDGTPEHLAKAIQFLAEHEFLTGVMVPVDGGRSIFAGVPSSDALAHPDYQMRVSALATSNPPGISRNS
jgi:pteridine reductase